VAVEGHLTSAYGCRAIRYGITHQYAYLHPPALHGVLLKYSELLVRVARSAESLRCREPRHTWMGLRIRCLPSPLHLITSEFASHGVVNPSRALRFCSVRIFRTVLSWSVKLPGGVPSPVTTVGVSRLHDTPASIVTSLMHKSVGIGEADILRVGHISPELIQVLQHWTKRGYRAAQCTACRGTV
jgi:hypothetical protein